MSPDLFLNRLSQTAALREHLKCLQTLAINLRNTAENLADLGDLFKRDEQRIREAQ